MEQIELSNGEPPFIHRSSAEWVKHRFRQGNIHQCSLHLLISDAIFILTHPHTLTHAHAHRHTHTHTRKAIQVIYLKTPRGHLHSFGLCASSLLLLSFFFYFSFISHCRNHNLKQLICFHLCSKSKRRYSDSCASWYLKIAFKKHREHVCWPFLPFPDCQILTLNHPSQKKRTFWQHLSCFISLWLFPLILLLCATGFPTISLGRQC